MRLPDFLHPLFKNYDISTMDSERHYVTIIKTVLAYGEWEHIKWLFEHYGRERIKEVFLEDYNNYRTLPEPTLKLWGLLFAPGQETQDKENKITERWRGRRLSRS